MYLIAEFEDGSIKYCKSIPECANIAKISSSMISKHSTATKENPYCPNKSNVKIYYSNKYILTERAVQNEESSELLQTNIGEDCNVNTEITKVTKETLAS